MTTNRICHQKLEPHTTKQKQTNQSAKDYTTTNIITRYHPVSKTLYNRTSWRTQQALSSDHLLIVITITIQHDYRLQQNQLTFTNYKKADLTKFTEYRVRYRSDHHTHQHTHCEHNFTNIILMAVKHNIPNGRMYSNCRLLPAHME